MPVVDMQIARLRATRLLPYLNRMVLSTIMIESDQVPTMGIDKYMRIYYNPVEVSKWTTQELAWVILHEVFHILMNHDKRRIVRVGENPSEALCYLWNLAGDISINRVLENSGGSLPEGAITRAMYSFPDNLTTEDYYDLLLEKYKDQLGTMEQSGIVGNGSGSDGVDRPWEAGQPCKAAQGGKAEESDDESVPYGLDDYERQRLKQIIAQDIVDYAKSQGNVHGDILRIASGILKPACDPRKLIMAEVKYSMNCVKGFGSSTWKVPNRRTPPRGLRLPANICPVPKPLIIVDTSGSMGAEELGLALGVVAEVTNTLPTGGVKVITGDVNMARCQQVFHAKSVQLAGGGGTDMGAIMVDAVANFPDIDIIIVITDGYTPWPTTQLKPKCLALITDRGGRNQTPEWIREVFIRPPEVTLEEL